MEDYQDPYKRAELLLGYLRNELNEADKKWVTEWLEADAGNHLFLKKLLDEEGLQEELAFFSSTGREEAWVQLQKAIRPKYIRLWRDLGIWKYAAILILCLFAGWLVYRSKTAPAKNIPEVAKADVLPGGNKAILTLSTGKQISLTDAENGTIAKEGKEIIKKSSDGTLRYEGQASSGHNQQTTYNTVTTPPGGQWRLILPDSTRVMLDAASSIKYPVFFNGKERRVEITGQAYFEVAHNEKMPFRVVADREVVEDIGTEFNINAYPDEPSLKTTLISGSVEITKGDKFVLLKPGQQANIKYDDPDQRIAVTDNANIEEATAWKNGLFHFGNSSLQEVMRQISRWYDVDVVYEGNIPHTVINGEAYRNLKASQVFEVLNDLKINFRIEGKKIIVTNKPD